MRHFRGYWPLLVGLIIGQLIMVALGTADFGVGCGLFTGTASAWWFRGWREDGERAQ